MKLLCAFLLFALLGGCVENQSSASRRHYDSGAKYYDSPHNYNQGYNQGYNHGYNQGYNQYRHTDSPEDRRKREKRTQEAKEVHMIQQIHTIQLRQLQQMQKQKAQ